MVRKRARGQEITGKSNGNCHIIGFTKETATRLLFHH